MVMTFPAKLKLAGHIPPDHAVEMRLLYKNRISNHTGMSVSAWRGSAG